MRKHQVDVEQLRKNITRDKELHETQITELQQQYKHEKENIQIQFKEKLEGFCKKRSEQYDKDKDTWMHIFRKEVETKMRGLSETNQYLGHNAKVLEEKNEECKIIIDSINQDIIMSPRTKTWQSKQDTTWRLDLIVQKAAVKRRFRSWRGPAGVTRESMRR